MTGKDNLVQNAIFFIEQVSLISYYYALAACEKGE
jgi:hypothetical protein